VLIRETYRLAFVLLLPVLALAGCGSSVEEGVIVTGKIIMNGDPLKAPRRDVGIGVVYVKLVPVDVEGGETESVEAAEDGTFKIIGPGKGVPPGSYKLAISQQGGPDSDMLIDKFSEETTPITVNLPKDKVGDTIDLGTIDLSKPPESL